MRSAHDCAEGGLAIALTECAIGGEVPLGFEVSLDDALPLVPLLFGEAQGRIVLSCEPARAEEILALARDYSVPARRIGTVKEAAHGFVVHLRDRDVRVSTSDALHAWREALPRRMDTPITSTPDEAVS